MTLTLEISPEAEARLKMFAAERGQDVTQYLVELAEYSHAIDLSEFEDQADFDDSVAGVREGLADLEAGRTHSFEETSAEMEKHLDELEKRQKHGTAIQEKVAA